MCSCIRQGPRRKWKAHSKDLMEVSLMREQLLGGVSRVKKKNVGITIEREALTAHRPERGK